MMKFRSYFLFLLFSAWLLKVHAYSVREIRKWETADFVFTAMQTSAAPFQEKMGCVFIHETGKQIDVPGFYNGNDEWLVRFTPGHTGKWTARTYASLPELSGLEQAVHVIENDPSEQGGIILHPEYPQHFAYESGKAYHLLAFEADWLFALDYGDPGLPKTQQLVKAIRQNGFNQIIMNVYAFDVNWKKDPKVATEHEYGGRLSVFPFGGTNESPDHSRINIDFFKHLDRVIALLDQENLVSHLMIYVWNKQVNWPEANSAEDNTYFDYVIKRYQAYNNIIWDISKEALGYGHDDMDYITDRIERLRKLDAYHRLITVHDFGYCSKFPEKVDFISIQSWSTPLYTRMRNVGQRFPKKPIFNIEHGGYERSPYAVFLGNFDEPEICLRRNYLCAFAGTYTTYYWQASSWNVIIHDPLSEAVIPQPRFDYYHHFADFFERYPLEQFKPADKFSASGLCLTNEKDMYLYFVPAENVAIDIKQIPPCDSLEITWFHPLRGTYSPTTHQPWSNYFRLRTHFKNTDSILLIRAH